MQHDSCVTCFHNGSKLSSNNVCLPVPPVYITSHKSSFIAAAFLRINVYLYKAVLGIAVQTQNR